MLPVLLAEGPSLEHPSWPFHSPSPIAPQGSSELIAWWVNLKAQPLKGTAQPFSHSALFRQAGPMGKTYRLFSHGCCWVFLRYSVRRPTWSEMQYTFSQTSFLLLCLPQDLAQFWTCGALKKNQDIWVQALWTLLLPGHVTLYISLNQFGSLFPYPVCSF